MIFKGLLGLFLLSCVKASNDNAEEIPFVTSQGEYNDQKVSNLLPDLPDAPQSPEVPFVIQPAPSSGRSDIEIEKEERTGGYVYPKPSKPFNLPPFKTLSAEEPLDGAAAFSSESSAEEFERSPRSPQRPGYFFPSRPRPIPGTPGGMTLPNFPGGMSFPNYPGGMNYPGIRPLPALYARPLNF